MKKPCEVPGCTATVPSSLVMCPRHWRMVPYGLKREVYEAWDERREEETPTTRRKHQNAKTLVIQAVQKAELAGGTS